MIDNQDNYLFLKQILIAIQAQRNGAELSINDTLIEPEQTASQALARLQSIEDNFTVPQFTDRVKGTTIDFTVPIEAIKFWTTDLRDKDLPNNEAMQLILDVEKPDNLYRSVTEYPLLTCHDEHKTNMNEGVLFPIAPQTAIDAANAIDDALILINKWVVEDLSHFSVAQLIILLNCVQMLDEMFQFGNDCFIGC